jgi:hypothetical protein
MAGAPLQSRSAAAPSGPFTPPDSASLQLWLQADTDIYQDAAGTTPATSDADPVRRWNDQSGNGNDFINSAGADATRPIYKTPLSLVGGLRFSAAQYLLNSTALGLSGADVPSTCIFAFKLNVVAQGTVLAAASSASATPFYRFLHSSGGPGELKFSPRDDASSIKELVSGALDTTNYFICSFLCSGTTINFRVDGAASGTADQDSDVGQITLDQSALGVLWRQAASFGEYAQMDLIEIFLWNTLLSQASYDEVEAHLSTITGIAVP